VIFAPWLSMKSRGPANSREPAWTGIARVAAPWGDQTAFKAFDKRISDRAAWADQSYLCESAHGGAL